MNGKYKHKKRSIKTMSAKKNKSKEIMMQQTQLEAGANKR